MITNRELFASMTLEPISADKSDQQDDTTMSIAAQRRQYEESEKQNANTRRVIHCMKRALSRSMSLQQMRESIRPLDPSTDFSLVTRVKFDGVRTRRDAPVLGGGCCASAAVRGDEQLDSRFEMEGDGTLRPMRRPGPFSPEAVRGGSGGGAGGGKSKSGASGGNGGGASSNNAAGGGGGGGGSRGGGGGAGAGGAGAGAVLSVDGKSVSNKSNNKTAVTSSSGGGAGAGAGESGATSPSTIAAAHHHHQHQQHPSIIIGSPKRLDLPDDTDTDSDSSADDDRYNNNDSLGQSPSFAHVDPANSIPFEFTDFAPMCFRHIRSFMEIEPESFLKVLCESNWHSIPTPGKSSAQLYFCGQNWVIKTMTESESDFLRRILHRYYYHVRDNPHTLLPHFVGHHRLAFKDVDGTDVEFTFVIMQNVFATPLKIHTKFDLKGSTVGRFATAAEKKKTTCTQKDLDINKPLRLGEPRRAVLMEQMRRDCDFLRRSEIMDYSFLIGIHRMQDGGGGQQQQQFQSPPAASRPGGTAVGVVVGAPSSSATATGAVGSAPSSLTNFHLGSTATTAGGSSTLSNTQLNATVASSAASTHNNNNIASSTTSTTNTIGVPSPSLLPAAVAVAGGVGGTMATAPPSTTSAASGGVEGGGGGGSVPRRRRAASKIGASPVLLPAGATSVTDTATPVVTPASSGSTVTHLDPHAIGGVVGGGGGAGGAGDLLSSTTANSTTGGGQLQQATAGGGGGGASVENTPPPAIHHQHHHPSFNTKVHRVDNKQQEPSAMASSMMGGNSTTVSTVPLSGTLYEADIEMGLSPVWFSDERCFTADSGGMLSLRRDEIYYIGIIDILQEYNWWKRAETFFMGTVHDRSHISSVDPRMYAGRFFNFMDSIII